MAVEHKVGQPQANVGQLSPVGGPCPACPQVADIGRGNVNLQGKQVNRKAGVATSVSTASEAGG